MGTALAMLHSRVDADAKAAARLSHAIRRRATGEHWPQIDSRNLDEFVVERMPTPDRQQINLLVWMSKQVDDDRLGSIEMPEDEYLAGVVGVVNGERVFDLLKEATDKELIRYVPDDCYALTSAAWQVIEQVASQDKEQLKMATEKNRIFIGHGGSTLWRDLKDFLVDRLHLAFDEFNRESPAGIPNTQCLSQMLDSAGFAFLVMTAEDEKMDGKKIARMNVVHEAGLFQGRLGFNKAIVLIEEGCEEFSNIQGLGQIRFKGDLNSKKDEIRQVLEREGIIKK